MVKRSVTWSTQGQQEIAALFGQWASRVDNPVRPFNDMANVLAESQKEWFRTQGNGTWAPLKEPYRRWKKKRYPKRKILEGPNRYKNGVMVHEGTKLRNELTRRANFGGAGARFGVEKITREGLTIGTDLPYAEAHQFGIGVPKRPPLKPLDPATEAKLTKIIQTHIVGETIGRNNR